MPGGLIGDLSDGASTAGAPQIPEVSPKSSKKPLAALAVAVILILGGAFAYSTLGSRQPHQTVHGTFTISNASYDPSNEFEDPNFTDGIDGCEGDGGYGDLNSGTQVVVKDDHGNEVARTELGEGQDDGDEIFGGCKFSFQFDVTKGPKYFVVSVGHRGESKYTYEELSEPEAIELGIGS